MEKKLANKFTITSVNGDKVVCDKLITFDCNNKHYVIYTDNSEDDKGNINVYASCYEFKNDKFNFLPIKTDKEWQVVNTVLRTVENKVQ